MDEDSQSILGIIKDTTSHSLLSSKLNLEWILGLVVISINGDHLYVYVYVVILLNFHMSISI